MIIKLHRKELMKIGAEKVNLGICHWNTYFFKYEFNHICTNHHTIKINIAIFWEPENGCVVRDCHYI